MFAASGVLTAAIKGKYLSTPGWYWLFYGCAELPFSGGYLSSFEGIKD